MAGWAKKLENKDNPVTQFITQQSPSPAPQLRSRKKKKKVQIGFRCSPELKERLNAYCENNEVYIMDAINLAIEDYLKAHGG